MNCKFCNLNKSLVKSHIIPESFYRDIQLPNKPFKIYSAKEGVHTKRSQIGLYDPNILCSGCEGKFHLYDDYGTKVLLQSLLKIEYVKDNNEIIGYQIYDIDYKKFKLFIMSMLWRADISSKEELKAVHLGPYSKKLEDHIKFDNPGDMHDFAVYLAEQKFHKSLPIMITPHKVRWLDMNFYEIAMGRYKAFIKVDNRSVPNDKISWTLQPDKPLLVPYFDFTGTPFEKIVGSVIRVTRQLETGENPR